LRAEAAQAADERGWAADGQVDEVAFVFAGVNDHAGFDSGEGCAFVLGNAEIGVDDGVGVERGVDGREESIDAFAGGGRKSDRCVFSSDGDARVPTLRAKNARRRYRALAFWTSVRPIQQGYALVFGEEIDFIEDFDARLGEAFQFAENFFDLDFLFFCVGGSGVADVDEYLGLRDLFECGAEAGDEGVGQVADEANGVGEKDTAAAGQLDGAKFGIERGEHARGREHLRAGDGVEEGAFAGVGVANQGDGGHGNSLAALALLAAHTANGFEVELELIDAALDAAAICFKLCFARAAGADAAAKLRHGFAAASEAREHVFELREFDLQLALAGAGVAGEDIEDELRAIEDAAWQRGLEVAQLRG